MNYLLRVKFTFLATMAMIFIAATCGLWFWDALDTLRAIEIDLRIDVPPFLVQAFRISFVVIAIIVALAMAHRGTIKPRDRDQSNGS